MASDAISNLNARAGCWRPFTKQLQRSGSAPLEQNACLLKHAELCECSRLVSAGQLEPAFHALSDVLLSAAKDAGCKQTGSGRGQVRKQRDKPYFDAECRQMRRHFRRVLKSDVETGCVLARRYITVLRRKCRQHRQQQTPALLRQLRGNDKAFWRQFNRRHDSLPAPLASHPPWQPYHARLCAPAAQRVEPPVQNPPAQRPPSGSLHDPILQSEVEMALPKLSNGKASAQAGWPAEVLRYAAYWTRSDDGKSYKVWMLASLLADMLNAFFQGGSIPACITSALVTPVHKKGSDLDTANYRPIAVGEPLYRLYTIILNKRLVEWTEDAGLRSPAQAGFRPNLSTIHHLFALRHFIDRARIRGVPLFTCFVDIQKAYDSVQHPLLWARLQKIGIHAKILAAIQSLYSSGTISMKIGGTVGPPEVQQVEVRQGCPLSPTLFGLFFDGLHDHIRAALPTAGLQLDSGRRVPFLCYADDVVLMAESVVALQQLIDGMHDFYNCAGLTISVAKTEVVVFHGMGVSGVWSVGGHLLPRSESFKYLGLVFHESGQVDVMFQRLYRNALGSVARLVSSFKQLGCSSSLPMKRRLFATLVAPAASYGVRCGVATFWAD